MTGTKAYAWGTATLLSGLLGVLLVAGLALPAAAKADVPRNPIPAPVTGCYVGAYVDSGPAGLPGFDAAAGKHQAMFMTFLNVSEKAFDEPGTSYSIKSFCQTCKSLGAIPYITLQPSHATATALMTASDVTWLSTFATQLGALDTPFFLRFGHEMNGDWYPWGWTDVPPATYIAGFQQAATIMRAHAPKVAMVWAPSQNWGPSTDELYSTWYPGDEYVDWVGLTTYQWPSSGLASQQFIYSVANGKGAEADFYTTFAVGHDKPMMIAETGCGDDDATYYDNEWAGGTDNETGTYGTGVGQGAQNWWILQLYKAGTSDSCLNVRFPRIKAVTWFAKGDYGFGGTDPTRHSTGFSTYAAATADPYWLSNVMVPSTVISALPTGWSTDDVTFTLSAYEAGWPDGIQTYYRLNSGALKTYSAPVEIVHEGTTTIEYRSIDASGAAEVTRTATVRYDGTAPQTSDDHSATYSLSATIHLLATDNGSGVAATGWTLDGVPGAGMVVQTSVIGTHTLRYWSTDVAGNVEAVKTVSFVVQPQQTDTTAPSTVISGVPSGWVNHDVSFTLTPSDPDSPSGILTQYWVGTSAPLSYAAPVVISREGVTEISYCSADVYGNREETKTATIRIDRTPPTLVGRILPAYSDVAALDIEATDGLSGLDGAEVKVDGGAWTPGTRAVVSSRGSHTLAVHAWDRAGNSVTSSYDFGVSVACTLSAPSASGTLKSGGAITLRGAVRPAHAGKLTVAVQLNSRGRWRTVKTLSASAGSGGVWSAHVRLPTGAYRLRALMPAGSWYLSAVSAWRGLRVR